MKALAPLNDKGFYTCLFVFVYDLPTVLLAYDPFEDAGSFPFHFVCCLCRTQGAQVAEEGAVGVEGAGAAFGFWCLEVAGVEELPFFQSA